MSLHRNKIQLRAKSMLNHWGINHYIWMGLHSLFASYSTHLTPLSFQIAALFISDLMVGYKPKKGYILQQKDKDNIWCSPERIDLPCGFPIPLFTGFCLSCRPEYYLTLSYHSWRSNVTMEMCNKRWWRQATVDVKKRRRKDLSLNWSIMWRKGR